MYEKCIQERNFFYGTTAEVHEAFQCALEESLNIQNKLYNLMSEKGWYKTEEAEQAKIDQTKQKFANAE